MKEIQDIIRSFDEAEKNGLQTALATVVQVQGSSYRRPGARMLVTEEGKLTGAISGGCLEGDALRKARLVMAQQKAMLVTYDTTDEDDAKLGVGLGCNGIIQILVEPINANKRDNPIALLKNFLSKRQEGVLITLFSLQNRLGPQPGTCLLLPENEKLAGTCPDLALQETLIADAAEVLKSRTSLNKTYHTSDAKITGFLQLLKPVVSLVIIGAGNDVVPLVQMASVMGWEVTVADGRGNYATAERFPSVQRLLVAKPDQVFPQLAFDEQTAIVLMTHNYNYDLAMLRQLITINIPYVGVLGPKKKLMRLLDELQEEGVPVNEELLNKIYGPVGLDIGAETPEEIALSIISEIKAVLAKSTGASLRTKEVIHDRNEEEITQDATLLNLL